MYCLFRIESNVERLIAIGRLFCLTTLIAFSLLCSASEMVLLHGKHELSPETETVRELSKFYGLSLVSIDVSVSENSKHAIAQMRKQSTRAVLISYDSLGLLNRKDVLQGVKRPGNKRVPILVFGIVDDDSGRLRVWSENAIDGCSAMPRNFGTASIRVGDQRDIVGLLAERQLPAVDSYSCELGTHFSGYSKTILSTIDGNISRSVFSHVQSPRTDIFFAPKMELVDNSWIGEPLGISKAFSSVAPVLLFLKYAAGEYAWHSVGQFANLTIDDPWLVEPYGHLSYKLLLPEMEKHNFHTTIAFIPWNFDRSEAGVAELFRSNPKRFSISIHGNDHSHQEFAGDESASISVQSSKIRQSIARMERFQKLTGIPYDRFEIFPHRIAAEATFAQLSLYGFLGTANSLDVPADVPFPKDPMFLLRPYTTNYGGFLSMFRYSAEQPISEIDIAVQAFLGNPLLFYGHQQFFDSGIGAFNRTADFVNSLQPDTNWTGLGEIARNLYLVRKRDDGAFDIRMMSNQLELATQQGESEFYIEGSAPAPPNALTVDLNGEPQEVKRQGGDFLLKVTNPAKTIRVSVKAENDLVLAKEDVGKRDLRVLALRKLSDFRDLKLSRSPLGRKLVSAYYQDGWNLTEEHFESWKGVGVVVIGLVLIALIVLRRRFVAIFVHRDVVR